MKSLTVGRKLRMFLVPLTLLMVGSTACNKNPQGWLNIANQDLPILEQQAVSIIAIADPADLPLAQKVSSGVSAGLKLVSDAVTAYKENPSATNMQAVAAALAQAGVDLPALLNGLAFKDQIVGLAITGAVTAIVTTLDIVAANLPVSTQTPQMRMARGKRMPMKMGRADSGKAVQPEALKARWNASVCDKYPALEHCPRM